MSELIIAQVARRAADRRTQIELEMGRWPKIPPPYSEANVETSERALGFSVPTLLIDVYRKVGNGGFGPGYGLLGLLDGAVDDQGHDAVKLYQLYSSSCSADPEWKWPHALLPICHWGCAIYSCIDCESEGFPIIIFDPNLQEESWAQCFIKTKRNFESWLGAWASGVKLWDETYGEPEET